MCEEKEYGRLSTEHGTYTTILTEKYIRRTPWAPGNPKQIRSIIPGTILSIGVKEGQTIRKGDELLAFTAMKMNNVLRAPADGRIKKINVRTGDKIPKGHVMIEFD